MLLIELARITPREPAPEGSFILFIRRSSLCVDQNKRRAAAQLLDMPLRTFNHKVKIYDIKV